MRILFLLVALVLVLIGCNSQEQLEKDPIIPVNGHTQDEDKLHLKFIIEIKEDASKGRMKGIDTPLGTTYQEIVDKYGEPKGISNEECWTYSYGHLKNDNTVFYFYHDSCNNRRNILEPETILNKISASPEFLDIQMTESNVKLALGKPDEEYLNEAYGGYYLIYDLVQYRLIFIAEENSNTKYIYRVQVASDAK